MKTLHAGIKLVVFMLVTTLATSLLAVAIANVRFDERVSYRAVFSNVTGLVEGADVRVAGVRVGAIESVQLYKNELAMVEFTVSEERPLYVGTRAHIRYRNMVGQRYLELTPGPGPHEKLEPRGLIPKAQTEPALDLTALFNGFRPLFKSLDGKQVNKLSMEIIRVLQGQSGTVNSLLAHVASLTNTLANRDKVIGQVIDNLNQVLGTLSKRDERVSNLILQMQQLVTGLAGDRKAIGASLAGINQLTASTAGLVQDSRPVVEEDIEQLGRLAKTLDTPKNRQIIDDYLQRLPGKLNRITRTASYGSWFNFYLCGLDAKVDLPGSAGWTLPQIRNETARCKAS